MIIKRRLVPKTEPKEAPKQNEELLIDDFTAESYLNETVMAESAPNPNEKTAEPPKEQTQTESQIKEAQPQIQPEEPLPPKAQTPAPAPVPVEEVLTPEMELQKKLDEIEKIDITSLEFKERFERRRGERRRGYRRIDERTLVSRAQEEAQSIRELAAKEGYKTGIEEAHTELENLKATLCELLNSKKEAYDAISGDMLELSLEIAKKIIKKEVELSSDVLKGVLEEVFEEVSSNEEKITIKVAPDEVEFARASMPDVLKNSAIDAKIIIIADEAVEKGSCVVMTSNGVIDANFSTQLSIIQNAFGIYKGGN